MGGIGWNMETLLINEQFVFQFKYWKEGHIRTGMRFRNNLFEYVSQFNQLQRNQAFELAWRLSQSGKEAIVTASASQYTVWHNMRPVNSALVNRPGSASASDRFSQIPHELALQTA
jgi:hypothetical protein